ncbi:hypothetical protein GCM10028798_12150 [Humibacter antri]
MTTALLDTSVLVALKQPSEAPPELGRFDSLFISSLSYSELRMGLCTVTGKEAERRRDALDELALVFGAGLPFDDFAAVAYGRIVRRAVEVGQGARRNTLDRMVAGVAASRGMTLATRNAVDLKGLDGLVTIVEV